MNKDLYFLFLWFIAANWRNLPKDDQSSLFLHLHMDDTSHFGYKQKFQRKQTGALEPVLRNNLGSTST
jgi:hypothetical protein